jgi:hypothetical protein
MKRFAAVPVLIIAAEQDQATLDEYDHEQTQRKPMQSCT